MSTPASYALCLTRTGIKPSSHQGSPRITINELPDELIIEIVCFADNAQPASERSPKQPFAITASQISRRLRRVLSSAPLLWSTARFHYSTPQYSTRLFDIYLERSGGLPIDIDLDFRGGLPKPMYYSQMSLVLLSAQKHASRWRSFTLCDDWSQFMPYALDQLRHMNIPSLQVLDLVRDRFPSETKREICSLDYTSIFPNLQELRIRNLPLPRGVTHRSLTTLCLFYTQSGMEPTVDELGRLFATMPQLQKLQLHGSICPIFHRDEMWVSRGPSILLPHVEDLELSFSRRYSTVPFLRRLELPQLKSLRLTSLGALELDSLSNLALTDGSPRFSRLEHFSISLYAISAVASFVFLRHLPALTDLILIGYTNNLLKVLSESGGCSSAAMPCPRLENLALSMADPNEFAATLEARAKAGHPLRKLSLLEGITKRAEYEEAIKKTGVNVEFVIHSCNGGDWPSFKDTKPLQNQL
jgi:hypothetical protein